MFDQNKAPFFSVIIPTYNRASTIGLAIKSVINQSFNNWELIVIDDGSVDNTKEVVDSFLDHRVKYYWQENQERSATRNIGVEFSKGDWICFLDSDDEYQENHLQTLFEAISLNKDFFIFRTGLTCLDSKSNLKKTKMKESDHELNTYPYDFMVFFAFHKTVFKKYQFDHRFFQMEDMHFLIRCGEEFKFYQIPDWTYIYHINPKVTGRIGRDFEKYINNKNLCIDDMLTFRFNPIRRFLVWTKLTNGLMFLYGSIRHKPSMIIKSMSIITYNFLAYPITFIRVVTKIIVVKFCEFAGITLDNYRF